LAWKYRTPGIPDELFERSEQVPITKEEVRAIVISKLRLKDNASAIDVGCGSGSITVEICLQTKSKEVYAIDFNENAVELTRKNLLKFGTKAEVISSRAQDILWSLPKVDAIVVGGTWGDTEQIVRMAIDRLNTGGRIVVDTILIETMHKALIAVNQAHLADIDLTQVIVAKARTVPTGTMMISRNPVLIISATKFGN